MNMYRQRPSWVDEEMCIQQILHDFLDAYDSNSKPIVRITEKKFPELYDFTEDDPQYLWGLLKTLDNEYHLLTIKQPRNKAAHERYDGATLSFNIDKEKLLREWLNRPAFDPYTLMWNDQLAKVTAHFDDAGIALQTPLRYDNKTAAEILHGFVRLADEIQKPQTLRNLSAKCFWGDSKYLDNKKTLLQALFNDATHTITSRPLLITIALQEDINDVIFIENLDSFLMMKQLTDNDPRFTKTALVYSAGFKGTSPHARKPDNVIFGMLTPHNSNTLAMFKAWWLQTLELDIQCYFWGDMDYAGLSILKSLKQSFSTLQAWQPGFEKMLSYHRNGLGHTIRDSKKMKQLDPGITGCDYADSHLLPAIRKSQRFLDQEVIAYYDFQ